MEVDKWIQGSSIGLIVLIAAKNQNKPVSWNRSQLVRLNNMPVMRSSPEWTVLPYVGLTILLRGEYNKSLTAKPTSGTGRPRPTTVVEPKKKSESKFTRNRSILIEIPGLILLPKLLIRIEERILIPELNHNSVVNSDSIT